MHALPRSEGRPEPPMAFITSAGRRVCWAVHDYAACHFIDEIATIRRTSSAD